MLYTIKKGSDMIPPVMGYSKERKKERMNYKGRVKESGRRNTFLKPVFERI